LGKIFRKLPTKVQIRDTIYPIHLVKKPEDTPQEALDGIIFYGDRIEIKDSMSRAATESTLIHELLHGLGFHFKIRLSETMVIKLEQAIFQLFKKNGWKIQVK
jgi:hypothetical protein